MPTSLSRRDLFRGTAATGGVLALRKPASAQTPEPTTQVVEFTANGTAHRIGVGDDDSALHIIRERLGLTGAKEACGHGACGACTVLVDGVPHATCLKPASHLHQHDIHSIEGLSGQVPEAPVDLAALHPVQRAFLAEDALQCGYCTPGFIVESIAFYRRWRADHADGVAPGAAEVAHILSGHLCRCGAYEGIQRAVQGACAGRFESGTSADSHARIEAAEKVSGRARYTVDVSLPGMMEGVFVRSPVAAAGLARLDAAAASKVPGVRAVLHLMDPGGTIRHAGQPLALVVAESREVARHAARLVDVSLSRGRVACDMASAKAEGAPIVYAKRGKIPVSAEMPVLPAAWHGNERGPSRSDIGVQPGQALKAVAEAPAGGTTSGTWTTAAQCHSALEPHAYVARWEGGKVTVWASTQMVHALAEELADHVNLPLSSVVVIADHVGGAFGAKAAWDAHLGFLVDAARQLAVPIRYVPDRHEELMLGGYRPPQEVKVDVVSSGVGQDVALRGIRMESRGDSGVAVGANVGGIMRLRYPGTPKYLEDYDVITHAPAARPFRGPGGPPGVFALEGAIDQIAADRGLSPIALRRPWDPAPGFQRLYDWAEQLPIWKQYHEVNRGRGRFRDGIGIGTASWYHFVAAGTEVMIIADAAGFHVRTACQDMGNGTRTTLAQAAGDALGVPPSTILVEIGNSTYVPGPMSAGSRTTVSVRPAVFDAAEQLQRALLAFATHAFGLTAAKLAPGGIAHSAGFTPWASVLALSPALSAIGRRKVDPIGYAIPIAIAGTAIGRYCSAAVQISRVRVDTWLGRVTVLDVWAGFSVGKIHSPVIARSQAIGGVLQALGYTLHEERRLDPSTGALLTSNLEEYHLPGIAETPNMEIYFDDVPIEGLLAEGIGLSEVTTCGGAASIANAIYRATGWRPKELPVRPDRLLAGIRA